MEKLSKILIGVCVLLMVALGGAMNVADNYGDRLELSQEANGHYEDAIDSLMTSNTAWETAYNGCTMDRTYDSINCNLDLIKCHLTDINQTLNN